MTEILRAEHVSKFFGGIAANTDIDFAVNSGSMKCIIGPNGAGKTTFLSIVAGQIKPDSGSIHFKGRDITGWPVHRVARAGIIRKFQVPSLYIGLSVFENLLLAVMGTGRRVSERAARVEEVASQVRLSDLLRYPVYALSHGHVQWLEIGLLLARDADLLLLDEPTAGMTTEETYATEVLLRNLIEDSGPSAIIIEHDIKFIRALGAPITVLHLGSVLAEGNIQEIENNEQVRQIYLGKSDDVA